MTELGDQPINTWDTDAYETSHDFVFEYGRDVVELLGPKPYERILDLGCGTAQLTAQIAASGAEVVGIDASEEMISRAQRAYPACEFIHADARQFAFDDPFDAVFSNAALHWIPEQDAVLDAVTGALAPNGRFVAELGGRNNVAAIIDAVTRSAAERGYDVASPWYFPSIGEYATRLESHGLEPQYAALFDRPTELEGGRAGLANWLEMFGDGLLSAVPEEERSAIITDVEDRLRDARFEDGRWVADYRRLRIVAINAVD